MGNTCNKGRLCECIQQNCRLSALFDCYHSLFTSSQTSEIYTSELPITVGAGNNSYATTTASPHGITTILLDNCGGDHHSLNDNGTVCESSPDPASFCGENCSRTAILECHHHHPYRSSRHSNDTNHQQPGTLNVSGSGEHPVTRTGSACSNCSHTPGVATSPPPEVGSSGECCEQQRKMLRQRSASHCPHHTVPTASAAAGDSGKRKCCCMHNSSNTDSPTGSSVGVGGGSGKNGHKNNNNNNNNINSNPGSLTINGKSNGPSSNNTNNNKKNSISSNHELSRTKRASSLRLLNKRFNFPLVNSNAPKETERLSSSSSVSAYTKRPGEKDANGRQVTASAVYHHGSSANHQIIYHTGASLHQSAGGGGRSSRKQKHIKINQLDDRALLHVFSFLTLRERFYYERVCRRWQALIKTSLAAPASLKIGEHSVKCNCQCDFYPSWDLPPIKKFARDEAGYIVVPNPLLTRMLNYCRSLRCINFSHCYLDDQALQIILANSDNIQCLHLNDIRLEEGTDGVDAGELSSSGERGPGASDENSGQNSEDITVTSAMSQFATEQLAVFSGLMRKLSKRDVKTKPANGPKAQAGGNCSANETQPLMPNCEGDSSKQSLMRPLRPAAGQSVSPHHVRKSVADIGTHLHHKLSANLSYPNIANPTLVSSGMESQSPATQHGPSHPQGPVSHMLPPPPSPQTQLVRRCSCCNRPMPECRSVSGTEASTMGGGGVSFGPLNPAMSGKNSNSNIAEAVTASVLSNTIGQRRAAQRRREWSRHRSGNGAASGPVTRQTGDESETDASVIAISPNAGALASTAGTNTNTNTTNTNTNTPTTTTANQHNKSSSLGENSSSGIRTARHLISPNMAPNISSLQTDSGNNDCAQCASEPNADDSSDSPTDTNENRAVKRTAKLKKKQQHCQQTHNQNHQMNGAENAFSITKMNDIQDFVEQEQRRRENRLSHLQHWKNLAKKLGGQIKCLSIGGLSSVDQVVIDLLLKYCVALEELRINNEIDILSYLTIIRHTVKRIFINCEHGIGLECVSLLAFRNYAEKVINLGRVDVPSELIDSVISTIGSNFSNLRSLHLRLHTNDIDLSTPAALLFENLFELNLQFVPGAVDQPFQKLIRLGWNSVQSLTIQYASITEESVRTIGENMPQLRKLILHAVEFRCDHSSKRYGHRICMNCSHGVWKSISTLPHLNHLRLHRVIVDAEICKSITRMAKLSTLELQYCSNVNDNIIGVAAELARRAPRRRFHLAIVSRGFVHYKPIEVNNLLIDIKVACADK